MLAGSMIGFFIAVYATFAAEWADARLIAMAIDYYAETGPDSLDEDQMWIPQRIPDLFPGAISFTRSHMLGYFGFRFSLQVALETPHVAHISGTDQQTGRLELA